MVVERKDGSFEFSIYAPGASSIELMGDFTGWGSGTMPMARDREGWWCVRCDVPPGDHEFMYIINGSAHVPDYAANGVRWNEDGQWVSMLNVPQCPRAGSAPMSAEPHETGREKLLAALAAGHQGSSMAAQRDPANARRMVIHAHEEHR